MEEMESINLYARMKYHSPPHEAPRYRCAQAAKCGSSAVAPTMGLLPVAAVETCSRAAQLARLPQQSAPAHTYSSSTDGELD